MFCVGCGNALQEGHRFCAKCGAAAVEPPRSVDAEAAPAPPKATARRASAKKGGGELLRLGTFDPVPMFIANFPMPPEEAVAWLTSHVGRAKVLDASPAAREYLKESDANGYDWRAFPPVAPAPGETLILWAESPDQVLMPDGRLVPREEVFGLPQSWGAVVRTLEIDPDIALFEDVPADAAGIVELLVATRDTRTGPIQFPVMMAYFPVSASGHAMPLDVPGSDNMVRALSYGTAEEQERVQSAMLLLLHPLVLTLARRHGAVAEQALQGPRQDPAELARFPLASRVVGRNFSIPVRRMAVADLEEMDLRQTYASVAGSSALIDITEAVVGESGAAAGSFWDDLRGIDIAAASVLVEAHPAEHSPMAGRFAQLMGLPEAWGGLCVYLTVDEASKTVELPPGAKKVVMISLAVQDKPGGLVRFPVAHMYVPLDRNGDPLPMRNGDLFAGPVFSADQDFPGDKDRMTLLIGSILVGLSRSARGALGGPARQPLPAESATGPGRNTGAGTTALSGPDKARPKPPKKTTADGPRSVKDPAPLATGPTDPTMPVKERTHKHGTGDQPAEGRSLPTPDQSDTTPIKADKRNGPPAGPEAGVRSSSDTSSGSSGSNAAAGNGGTAVVTDPGTATDVVPARPPRFQFRYRMTRIFLWTGLLVGLLALASLTQPWLGRMTGWTLASGLTKAAMVAVIPAIIAGLRTTGAVRRWHSALIAALFLTVFLSAIWTVGELTGPTGSDMTRPGGWYLGPMLAVAVAALLFLVGTALGSVPKPVKSASPSGR